MQLFKIIIGELIVVVASIFIFRSLWALLDEYFGYNYLTEFLIAGLVLIVIGLIVLNHEVKGEIEKSAKSKNSLP